MKVIDFEWQVVVILKGNENVMHIAGKIFKICAQLTQVSFSHGEQYGPWASYLRHGIGDIMVKDKIVHYACS
jgi:hypothetical protein